MDIVTAVGWILGLLGLWGTIHYGRQSSAVGKAFSKYIELEGEIARLQEAVTNRDAALVEVEQVRAQLRGLLDAPNITNEAKRLAQAADDAMGKKLAAESQVPPMDKWTYWARGDHTNSLPQLQAKLGSRSGSFEGIRYMASANLSLLSVSGVQAKELIEQEPGWRFSRRPSCGRMTSPQQFESGRLSIAASVQACSDFMPPTAARR